LFPKTFWPRAGLLVVKFVINIVLVAAGLLLLVPLRVKRLAKNEKKLPTGIDYAGTGSGTLGS